MWVELIIIIEEDVPDYSIGSDYLPRAHKLQMEATNLNDFPNQTHHPGPHPLLHVSLGYRLVGRLIDAQ